MFTKENYEEWLTLSYTHDNHYEGWELMWKESPADLTKPEERIRELNKLMIEAYPFLLPRNRWTDEVSEDYNYDYNEWEAIPDGWQKAFGWQLLNELNDLIRDLGIMDEFRIEQIKEKFGELRIYTNGGTEIWNLIEKYTQLSQITCISCGKHARYITTGWICPFCEDCLPKDADYELIQPNDNYKGVF